jgi:hypothetical protein
MRDVAGYERTTVLAAVVALAGVAGHYAVTQSFPAALDEWFMVFAVASLTILTVTLRRRTSKFEGHPADPPVWQHVRAKMRIEVDRRLVPIQHRPLKPAQSGPPALLDQGLEHQLP